ncbi:hypothetical protein Pd630_LPD04370 [Rhodococcus opacus PD630]|nr:hypothetical protein Pd630_LPD04370 [Rhodococcus opacus PD630]
MTVFHTDARDAGTCGFGVTSNRGVTAGRLRRTRRCGGLLGVGLVVALAHRRMLGERASG